VLEALQQNKRGFAQKALEAFQRLQEIRRQHDEYANAMTRKTALEEELVKLESEPDPGQDLDAEIAARERRIERGHAFQQAIRNYEADLTRFQEAQTKIAACEQEITLYDALAKALAPSGIPSQMIVEALEGVNNLLWEAAEHLFPERPLCLTPDLNIDLGGHLFATLSKSAKFRVGIAFQYALAKIAGARILMIDETDILDLVHRTDLVNFLLDKISDFDQILVFLTSDHPIPLRPTNGRADSWWLENGHISKIMEAAHG
jgi:DNA repair exonuclease SbcCD ATPase subunit